MAEEPAGLLEPTPLITALAKHAEAGGMAKLSGFVGPSGRDVVRLYQNLEMTSYLELSRGAILHTQKAADSKDGEVEIFVTDCTKITATFRASTSVTAGEFVRGRPRAVFQQKGTEPTPNERCRRANAAIDAINVLLYEEVIESFNPDQATIDGLLQLRDQQRELRTKYCGVVAL